MNIEDLSKTQLLLLAILVSFVTSIATGITTVTLLDEAPEPVVSTIHRVVERTVEKVEQVVPGIYSKKEDKSEQQIITKETTIVVKEEDQITAAIEKNAGVLVRIFEHTKSTTSPSKFIGMGVLVSGDGELITDASLIAPPPQVSSYTGVLSDKSSHGLTLVGTGEKLVALMKINRASEELPKFNKASLADPESLKLGQTVMSLGGHVRDTVGMGIISAMLTSNDDPSIVAAEDKKSTSTPDVVSFITTTIPNERVVAGTPIFNIFGELVALTVYDKIKESWVFLTVNLLQESIEALTARLESDSMDNAESPDKGSIGKTQNAAVGSSINKNSP